MSAGARTINALEIGYTSPSAFAQVCRCIVGVTPTAYRNALSFEAAAEQRWKLARGVSHRITVASLPPHL